MSYNNLENVKKNLTVLLCGACLNICNDPNNLIDKNKIIFKKRGYLM